MQTINLFGGLALGFLHNFAFFRFAVVFIYFFSFVIHIYRLFVHSSVCLQGVIWAPMVIG